MRRALAPALQPIATAARSGARGIVALFVGSPGPKKTAAASALASALAMPLLRVELQAVVGKYIGETEKNLATLFDAAEQAGAVLFFDEADGLFGNRTEVTDTDDRHANAVRGRFLRHAERYPGLVILGRRRIGKQDRAYLQAIPRVFVYPSRPDMGRAL